MKITLEKKDIDYKLKVGDVIVFNNGAKRDYYMLVRDNLHLPYRLLSLADGRLRESYTTIEEVIPRLTSETTNSFYFEDIIKSENLELVLR